LAPGLLPAPSDPWGMGLFIGAFAAKRIIPRHILNCRRTAGRNAMYKPLDPLLHSELRLAVMSILLGVENADFVFLREQTEATAGNLSMQLDKLAQTGYIAVEKSFRGKKPRTVCRMTDAGREAFAAYVAALESYIKIDR